MEGIAGGGGGARAAKWEILVTDLVCFVVPFVHFRSQASVQYNMPCQGPVKACESQSNLVNFFLRAQ